MSVLHQDPDSTTDPREQSVDLTPGFVWSESLHRALAGDA